MEKSVENLWIVLLMVGVLFRLCLWSEQQEREWNDCSTLLGQSRLNPLILRMWSDSTRDSRGRNINYTTNGFTSSYRNQTGMRIESLDRKIEWQGQLSCIASPKNFSGVSIFGNEPGSPDFFWKSSLLLRRVQSQPSSLWMRIHSHFLDFLDSRLEFHPELLGLVLAVWTGSMEGLSEEMQGIYRAGGLLHVLALSGQHVVIGVFLMLIILRGVSGVWVRTVIGRKIYFCVVLILPTLVAGLLCFSSLGCPSILRTLAMAVSLLVLRLRRFQVSTLQGLSSSVGMLILFSPELILSPGLTLSAIATYLLLKMCSDENLGNGFKKYLIVTLGMPILMIPISVFYFAKFSWSSLISNLCIGWSWDIVWIPLGFLMPLIVLLPLPLRFPVLDFLSQVWRGYESLHHWMQPYLEQSVISLVKLNWVETLLVEWIFLSLIWKLLHCASDDAPRIDFFRRKVSNG